jgi:hypothetical protein
LVKVNNNSYENFIKYQNLGGTTVLYYRGGEKKGL